jgi:hypothetical protein
MTQQIGEGVAQNVVQPAKTGGTADQPNSGYVPGVVSVANIPANGNPNNSSSTTPNTAPGKGG